MNSSSKTNFDTSMNNQKGSEIGLASCFGAFDISKTRNPEIIDYFEQEYHSEDTKKETHTGDIKNEESEDFGLYENPCEVSDRFGENDVDIIKTEIVAKDTFKEMEWDEFSNKPRSFVLEEEMIEEEKIMEEEKNEKEVIELSNQKMNEFEIITMKTESIESHFLPINIDSSVREVLQPRPNPRKTNKKKTKKTKSEKDETKNTIKNFGKGIIIFVQKEVHLVSKILKEIGSEMDHAELLKKLASVKNQLSRIQHLKELWTSEEYGREMRVLSEFFLRKISHSWIFNSRVENARSPLKYRLRLLEVIQDPENFFSLKWF